MERTLHAVLSEQLVGQQVPIWCCKCGRPSGAIAEVVTVALSDERYPEQYKMWDVCLRDVDGEGDCYNYQVPLATFIRRYEFNVLCQETEMKVVSQVSLEFVEPQERYCANCL